MTVKHNHGHIPHYFVDPLPKQPYLLFGFITSMFWGCYLLVGVRHFLAIFWRFSAFLKRLPSLHNCLSFCYYFWLFIYGHFLQPFGRFSPHCCSTFPFATFWSFQLKKNDLSIFFQTGPGIILQGKVFQYIKAFNGIFLRGFKAFEGF